MTNDLIAKLEAATQGSRALDVRVALTTGWRRITAPHSYLYAKTMPLALAAAALKARGAFRG